MSLRRTVQSALALACSLLLLVGCERSPTASNASPVALHVSAASISSNVSMVVIKVTATDIPVPLVFNFPVSAGAISGTITVPAGSARTITASAFDVGNTETHRGVVTMNLPAGTQPTLELKLLPLTSDQPINITVTSVVVTVAPSTLTLTVGAANGQLSATIKDGDGNPVAGTVKWATTDPSKATVDANGSVHATGAGTVQIVATFAGVASACTVTVFGGQSASLSLISGSLVDPVGVATPPGDDRLFVPERGGLVRLIKNGVVQTTPFLDVSANLYTSSESGLLSIAFHPSFAQNHFVYVLYTFQSGSGLVERVSRFTVTSNPDIADGSSETPILSTTPRATDFHNGGLLQFGPDGKLYIGFGDGGTSANAQSLSTLHGKILRIDVDAGAPYAIPPDNPFVGQAGARGEIWHYGLRNPWRYSFDPQTNDLYIADVGENLAEEVDVQLAPTPAGRNYGWPILEGSACFGGGTCNQAGLTLPVLTYNHQAGGCSIVGGFVYRGSGVQELTGHYLYSDYCAGFVKSFKFVNAAVTAEHDWTAQLGGPLGHVSAFGRDWRGELYITVLGFGNGKLYKFVPAT
jgi:glucose/arabinose dehydrogenase